jgi:hypothetical protein
MIALMVVLFSRLLVACCPESSTIEVLRPENGLIIN